MAPKVPEVTCGLPEEWVVDCKSVGSGEKVLVYVGRYLYRGVIQEGDIIGCANGQVSYRWRDSKTRKMVLRSALASIGLTIPAVAIVSLATGWTLTLGIDLKSTVLLILSLLVATLSLGTGRTTLLQGMVHLVIFAVYLVTTVVP